MLGGATVGIAAMMTYYFKEVVHREAGGSSALTSDGIGGFGEVDADQSCGPHADHSLMGLIPDLSLPGPNTEPMMLAFAGDHTSLDLLRSIDRNPAFRSSFAYCACAGADPNGIRPSDVPCDRPPDRTYAQLPWAFTRAGHSSALSCLGVST